MFLRILKSNPLISLVFPVFAALLIWGGFFFTHGLEIAKSGMPMFDVFWGWLLHIPFITAFTGLAILILEAFTWNRFINGESLLKQSSYFPALFYIILFCCRPLQIGFYPSLAALLFLIMALRRLAQSYKKEKALSEAFDAGFYVGIAALLYLPVSIFLLFLWIALITIRSVVWRELVVSFIGFLLPFAFALTYYSVFRNPEDFWYDKVIAAANNYRQAFTMNKQQIILLSALGLTCVFSLYSFLSKLSDNGIKSQKIWALMLWFICFAVGAFLLSPQKDARSLSLLVLPFSFIFSNYFLRAKSKWLPELLFLLIMAAITINIFY